MDKTNLQFFYALGAELRPITKMKADPPNRFGIIIGAIAVQGRIPLLLKMFPALGACRIAFGRLDSAVSSATDWFQKSTKEEFEKDDPMVNIMFSRVVDEAKTFETVLSAEIENLEAYHVDQKGIYSTTDLIEHADKSLPSQIHRKLGEKVATDIRQSGRCLAFDNGTAAGFHIMRAVESTLYQYYLHACKPPSTRRLNSWGAYIKALTKTNLQQAKEIAALIQQIKDLHRNPIMHPEFMLDSEEAYMLFELGKSAILAMGQNLPDTEAPTT